MVTTPRGLTRLGVCKNAAPNTKLGGRMEAQNTKRSREEMEETWEKGGKGRGCYKLVTSVRQAPQQTPKGKGNQTNLAWIHVYERLVFFFTFWPHRMAAGSQFPNQGWNLHFLQWECGVLTVGQPGKSLWRTINLRTTDTLLNNLNSTLKKIPAGTSVAIQWLRLHVPNAGGTGLIPGQGTEIPHQELKSSKEKLQKLINQ